MSAFLRRLHRWLSLPVAIIIAGIAVTGILLHIDQLQYPPRAGDPPGADAGPSPQDASPQGARPAAMGPARPPGPAPGDPSPAQFKRHRFILSLHTGDFLGPAGRYIYMAAGLVLLVLSVTGLWVYVDMFARRFRLGRKSIFWN